MNLTRAILERVQEVELEITPEFQKPNGIDMWAGVSDKTRKLVDIMVEKGHLTPIGLVPSNSTPVLVHAAKLRDSSKELSVIDELEKWADVALAYANINMGEYDPIAVLWPYPNEREVEWGGFWEDVVSTVTRVNDLTAAHGEAGQPSHQGLFDVIGDLVDQEVIAVNDLSEDPSKENMVWFPGNTTKYSIIDSSVFGAIQKKVEESNAWWGWSGSKGMFYLHPKAGSSVLAFWRHVRDLARWYLNERAANG